MEWNPYWHFWSASKLLRLHEPGVERVVLLPQCPMQGFAHMAGYKERPVRGTVPDIPSVFPGDGQSTTLVLCRFLSEEQDFKHHRVCEPGHVNSFEPT